jgi:hypothetical protein
MTLSSARATLGLVCTATPDAPGASGSFQLGSANQNIRLPGVSQAYSLAAVFAGNGDILVLDLDTNDTTGTTAWVAGSSQVETATAAGSVSAAGNAAITLTSTGMAGSPLTISVPVANGDTAATWAEKVRVALAANTVVAARFTISGTTTSIVLIRKPLATYTYDGVNVNIWPANDSALNLGLAAGTSTGITTASSSANTASGVATAGVYLFGGDGKDATGNEVDMAQAEFYALFISNDGSIVNMVGNNYGDTRIGAAESTLRVDQSGLLPIDDNQTFTATGSTLLTLTVFGTS